MNKAPGLPSEIESALKRYLEIQHEEQRLKREKADLQEKIGEFMAGLKKKYWYPALDGVTLKVRYRETSVIEYDESLLRERLGERYAAIVAPDSRKIRLHLDQIESLFTPILDLVGTPAPERVRSAIETGIVNKDEFTGAFKKTVKSYVAVSKATAKDLPDLADEEQDNASTD
jgi:seryl-tRNA(Sec) selenium transferase